MAVASSRVIGKSQYQDQALWQEEFENRRDMARLQITSNPQKGLTETKSGGTNHSSRRTVTSGQNSGLKYQHEVATHLVFKGGACMKFTKAPKTGFSLITTVTLAAMLCGGCFWDSQSTKIKKARENLWGPMEEAYVAITSCLGRQGSPNGAGLVAMSKCSRLAYDNLKGKLDPAINALAKQDGHKCGDDCYGRFKAEYLVYLLKKKSGEISRETRDRIRRVLREEFDDLKIDHQFLNPD